MFLRLPVAAATRMPSLATRVAPLPARAVVTPSTLRCRQQDSLIRTFASTSEDANSSAGQGGDDSGASTSSSTTSSSQSTPPSLSRESRQSETQAVNLRAVRGSDQIGAEAQKLKERLGSVTPPDPAMARRLVLGGGDNSEEKWRELDEKFNEYPDLRTFKGIGEAGADPGLFKRAVVAAVESVVGPVDETTQVSVRDSSGGKYVSVSVGPVTVHSGDEVVQVYAAMRETAGSMLKWYI